jgi:predicted kinase
MKPVMMLSGPVGAGKTTVARKLIECISGPVVYIEGDVFWSFISRTEKSQTRYKNFKTIMVSMLASSLPFARDGYSVILDFSIPPWFLDTARRIAKVREVPLDYVVICPDENICASRAASRAEGAIADYGPYHDLYVDFKDAGQYMIGDEFSPPEVIAGEIKKWLDSGKFRVT